ncbi:MAG: hypothetical protein HGA48_02810 [Candidatus Yonathbacteria bacterium]|nr:hypothetical protein [Candidatus Yonathbacteria bacterium]
MNDIRTTRNVRMKKTSSVHSETESASPKEHTSFDVRSSHEESPKNSEFFAYVKEGKKRTPSSLRSHAPRKAPVSPRKRSLVDVSDVDAIDKEDATVSESMSRPSAPQPIEWTRPGVRTSGGKGIWWIAAVAVFVFVIMLMNVFAGATVTLVPKQENTFIEGNFTAMRGGSADSQDSIGFEVMDVVAEESIEILATEERESERRASGTIVIYNTYSTNEQRLVKKTRFEDPAGHIYRINESVVIPGMRTEGGETIPGSVEVTVSADEPGTDFNIALVDFTIPGFKGSPQYDKMYARSKTPMTGGFVGLEKVASESEVIAAQQELEKKLSEKLLSDARSQTPAGSILAEYATTHTFEHLDPVPSDDNKNVIVTVRGTLHAMVFDGGEMARFIARRSVASYDDKDVYFSDVSKLSIGIVPEENGEAVIDDTVTISLGGTPHIVWTVDKKEVLSAIVGRSKKEFDETMKKFPAIASAQASMHPFWKGEFPEDAKDISVVQIVDGKEVK